MAGHSKWSTIKRAKAKNDAANSKIITKILRELSVAVKEGGPDPSTNPRLKNVIAKAKSNNVTNNNIERTIKKASGETDSINFVEITYEGYGPAGSAVFVEALTDNRNRTAGEVRHAFDRSGGSLGQTGSVSYLFTKRGEVIVLKNDNITEDDMTMHALEAGAEDVIVADEFYKIITSVESFEDVKTYFENNQIAVEDSMINFEPNSTVTLEGEQLKAFNKMIEMLENNDDIQEVYHNVEIEDEEE